MIQIIGAGKVSCYIDAAALMVMVTLLLVSNRSNAYKAEAQRIFRFLLWSITINCVISFLYHALYKQQAPWCGTAARVLLTGLNYFILVITVLWLAFVDRTLYGIRKQTMMIRLIRILPVIAILVLLVVNLFTDTVFGITEDTVLEPKPLYYVMSALIVLLFSSSALVVQHYDRKTKKIRFLHVWPVMAAIWIGFIPQFVSAYSTGILGFAVAAVFLHLSIESENRYVDAESGLYNQNYLAYMFDMTLAGKNDIQSVLILTAGGNLPGALTILHDVLHKNSDVIRVEETKFVVFSKYGSRTTLQYESSLVDEAVQRYNQEHPDDKIQISARCSVRAPQESSFQFVRGALDDKEAGSEVRGIVSMISELDRLDKELKLAADIQLNMLPMNFPPFPERKEFDLFASTAPAKEVGGDFYDFFLVDSDHLALVIADVSGKGIPAALFMMVSKTLIKNQMMSGCDPATALEHVNLQLCERNSSMMFVTVWLAVLEISTGRGLACNAGHENPGLFRAGGKFELLKYKHNIFVGVNKKAKYQNREFVLAPGDSVFVYTDGVPEATNSANEMFGEERLTDTLNQCADYGPEELSRHVQRAVDSFADSAPQFDDITMLCLKYYGPKNKEENQNDSEQN